MRVSLVSSGVSAPVRARWEALRVPVVRATSFSGSPLNSESADVVTVVPFDVLGGRDWAGIRVALAGSNRLFLVVGAGLGTAEVMLAARDGAFDVLDLEDSDTRWRTSIEEAGQAQALWVKLYGGVPLKADLAMTGVSAVMRGLRQTIARLRATDVGVLVLGESGVGKELVARALHGEGADRPFVAVNCASIPRDLLEAELFGAEKGAFTGAYQQRQGLLEQANGGTLFLDEVGEMDSALQPKLLRFLETRTARRVGGTRDYRVSLRVVAATNRDLDAEAETHGFRSDLYYRLAEVVLRVPPLRHRPEDIPGLVREFVDRANERFGKHIAGVEPALIRRFQEYPWPGNIRELKSAVDRLVLLFDGPLLREGWWEAPSAVARAARGLDSTSTVRRDSPEGLRAPGASARMALARELIAKGGCGLTEVAARCGVHPTTLFRWRKAGKV